MNSSVDDDESLQHTAAKLKRKGHAAPVDIGTAVMPHLLDDEAYEDLANQQFNSIVCEHHQKVQCHVLLLRVISMRLIRSCAHACRLYIVISL
jgi:hypothetical protein